MQILRSFTERMLQPDVWRPLALKGGHILLILIGAWLLILISNRLLTRVRSYAVAIMDRRGQISNQDLDKRSATVIAVLHKLVNSVIWMVALAMALTEINPHIEPVLASLGIAGLALGLGAQTLIKDWLGGLFLMLEDQIRIGDSVNINGISGTVEEINLRTTVLRGESGAVHIIPNGSIATLSNLTREYSYYIFETILAHKADANKALEILQQTAAEICAQERFSPVILAPIEIMGVARLGERGAQIRARIKTVPSRQDVIGRELNRLVKERFDGAGIAFPPPP